MSGIAIALALASAPSPMVVAGGALDPSYPDADIYLAMPETASPPPGKACAVAARYVERVNAGDYAGVAALYADDATFLEPMRPSLQGRAQIDEFYTKRIGAMKPRIIAVSYVGSARECMIALANRIEIGGRERYALVSVDHFTIRDDGRIASMVAFARPPRK